MMLQASLRKTPHDAKSSSRSGQGSRECGVFIEQFASPEAVEHLSERAVEEVALGGSAPVPVLVAAATVVGHGSGRGLEGGEGPEVAGVVEAVILDPAAGDAGVLAGSPGDVRRGGVCLQTAGVGETLAVVPDLSEYPSAELGAEAGKTEDDLSVRMLGESFLHRLGEVVGGGAGGLELDQEGEHLLAERVLDEGRMVGVVLRVFLGVAVLREQLHKVVQPAASSAMWRLASSWPKSSIKATSCVLSARSIPR
jgi:hypothetical protein